VRPLKQVISERIESEGPINFEAFMEMCLYYPGLGYYMKDSTEIGKGGDFYTSPHLHSVFGAMIGRQMQEMWAFLGRPEVFRVVEVGAGMGYFAADMLDYVRHSKSGSGNTGFLDCLKYTIVELNPSLRAHQELLLRDQSDKVNWLPGLEELEPFIGCFFSNELIDAFPVRLIEMDDDLMEIYVSVRGGDFIETRRPCCEEVREYLSDFGINLPRGYRTEVNLRLRNWVRQVSKGLDRGFLITIDYGYPAWDYYSEERNRGTLLCYYQHQVKEDPYRNAGEQDLTAHVNFSSLRRWGEEAGLRTIGFCAQGTYLVSLGIDEVIVKLYGDSPDPFEIAKIKGLLIPQGMGESHKVMIQYKGEGEPALKGFRIRNQTGLL
jgi:SAM-dependent MidA family methyltransferase